MSILADYSDDEWCALLQGPTLAILWVIQADHYSTNVTRLKMGAGTMELFNSTSEAARSDLVSAVIAALRSGQRPAAMLGQPRNLNEARRIVLLAFRRVATILDQKTAQAEAAAYVNWLLLIGRRVADTTDLDVSPPLIDRRANQALSQLSLMLREG